MMSEKKSKALYIREKETLEELAEITNTSVMTSKDWDLFWIIKKIYQK